MVQKPEMGRQSLRSFASRGIPESVVVVNRRLSRHDETLAAGIAYKAKANPTRPLELTVGIGRT